MNSLQVTVSGLGFMYHAEGHHADGKRLVKGAVIPLLTAAAGEAGPVESACACAKHISERSTAELQVVPQAVPGQETYDVLQICILSPCTLSLSLSNFLL